MIKDMFSEQVPTCKSQLPISTASKTMVTNTIAKPNYRRGDDLASEVVFIITE